MTVIRATITATRTAMIATYGVSESCVDPNAPNYNKPKIKSQLLSTFDAESYLMIYIS